MHKKVGTPITMNTLDCSLIEKAGYYNIFEIVRKSDPSIASHIKAWADCDNDSDRLNVYNGFLLSANYDALFDKGLITFDDNGLIIYSDRLIKNQIQDIGGEKYKALRWIDERYLPFLEWHRKQVFIE